MSKINTLAIDIGHNVNYDGGAIGIRRENDLNRFVGEELIYKCRESGITVVNCTPAAAVSLYDSLNKRVEMANSCNADFFLSIHHNACRGGEGTEALCIKGGESERVGNIILNEISQLGFRNRGVKDRRDLFVINKTIMPALLIECAFCDSIKDMANYDYSAMAKAILSGILKSFEITPKSSKVENSPIFHTVASGDTLWWITRNYGVTIDSVVNLNQLKDRNLIYVGQKIRVR